MASGGKAAFYVAQQVAKGTENTTVKKIPATGISIDSNTETVESAALTGNPVSSGGFVSAINAGGDVPFELTRDTLELILEGAGFVKTTGVDKNTYKHGTLSKWYTVVKELTDSSYHEKYVDTRINALTIEMAKKAYVKSTATFEALTPTNVATAYGGTVSAVTDRLITCLHISTITLGATGITGQISDLKITINNGLDTDDRAINLATRRSLDMQAATIEISGTMQFVDASTTKGYKDTIIANTEQELVVNVDSKIKFTFPKVVLGSYEVKPADKNKINIPFTAKAFYDETETTAVVVEVDTTAY